MHRRARHPHTVMRSVITVVTSRLHSKPLNERYRLLNEVAGATDATREAGSRSCKGIERLR